jgi:hypothetical protein
MHIRYVARVSAGPSERRGHESCVQPARLPTPKQYGHFFNRIVMSSPGKRRMTIWFEAKRWRQSVNADNHYGTSPFDYEMLSP